MKDLDVVRRRPSRIVENYEERSKHNFHLSASGCRKDAVACRAERGRVAAAEASARRGQRCRAAVVLAEIEAGRLRNDVTLLAIEL